LRISRESTGLIGRVRLVICALVALTAAQGALERTGRQFEHVGPDNGFIRRQFGKSPVENGEVNGLQHRRGVVLVPKYVEGRGRIRAVNCLEQFCAIHVMAEAVETVVLAVESRDFPAYLGVGDVSLESADETEDVSGILLRARAYSTGR